MSDQSDLSEDLGEWISSATARDMVGAYQTDTICKRAFVGLIKARAERFMVDKNSHDNVDVPQEFWWAEGHAALKQNWKSGDFETWIDHRLHLKAFGVTFLRADIERAFPKSALPVRNKERANRMSGGENIFIGHGGSLVWHELRNYLEKRLGLTVDEFNAVAAAGVPTVDRLSEMLDNAVFAFLVLTAEDEQKDGTVNARINVIHETGLFQGRLGFERAIVMLEDGCNEFSNIKGLTQMRFPKGNISAQFDEVSRVLEREKIITPRRA